MCKISIVMPVYNKEKYIATLAYIFIIKKTDNGRCIHIFQLGNIFFATKDVSA